MVQMAIRMSATIAETLRSIPIFALLDEQEIDVLAGRLEIEQFSEGKLLFAYGEPGDSMYVISEGSIELSVKTKAGETVVLETAGAGDFFGELSLLDGGPRNATASALSSGKMIVIDHGDLQELFRIRPAAAMDLLGATGRRLRQAAALLRDATSRNVNDEVHVVEAQSLEMRIADWITAFSGSMPFLYMHLGLFTIWIALNVHVLPFGNFDPFPFGLLTMVVSLEAIILSVFVLLSQNRQAARDKTRNDIEYEINLRAELEIQELHKKIDRMNTEILGRLARIERPVQASIAQLNVMPSNRE
jgi:CRP/FNR family transcriptional regulator, cyclic AMP receptor protein